MSRQILHQFNQTGPQFCNKNILILPIYSSNLITRVSLNKDDKNSHCSSRRKITIGMLHGMSRTLDAVRKILTPAHGRSYDLPQVYHHVQYPMYMQSVNTILGVSTSYSRERLEADTTAGPFLTIPSLARESLYGNMIAQARERNQEIYIYERERERERRAAQTNRPTVLRAQCLRKAS